MTPRLSLIWKEWNENFILLVIAIFIFLGMPVIGGMEDYQHSHLGLKIYATPWLAACGGVFAVFVAVGSACRDFGGRLEDFWRSRPVRVSEWMSVKFFVGLFVVLLACVVPLLVQRAVNGDKASDDPIEMAMFYPFLWTAAYSIGFLCGCVVRRIAHAAMLALGTLMLLYFLPVIFPPLQWMNMSHIHVFDARQSWGDNRPPVGFIVGMSGLSAILFFSAQWAVRHERHIESGPKLLYGSISAAALILLSTAAYQLGTNMPVILQADLPPGVIDVNTMNLDGNSGYVITYTNPNAPGAWYAGLNYQTVDVTDSEIHLGSPSHTDTYFPVSNYRYTAPGHPEIIYHVDYADIPDKNHPNDFSEADARESVSLVVSKLPWNAAKNENKTLYKLWEGLRGASTPRYDLYVDQNRLYLISDRLVIFDITDPYSPRLISDEPFNAVWGTPPFSGDKMTLLLPPVPQLTARQRLDVINHFGPSDGDLFCAWNQDTLCVYKLVNLTDTTAQYVKTGQYELPTLEKSFIGGGRYWGYMELHGNLLYACSYSSFQYANPHISVFDVGGPGPIRLVGHFSAPNIQCFHLLPDGRALVGGSKLWLVGPPPHRDVN